MSATMISQLKMLDTCALSDAMDSMGIESVLHGLRPLFATQKIIGPAYTVSYQPYQHKPEGFQPAGDYIDNVSSDAVVVIDNNGYENCSVWGGLLTAIAARNGVIGTVINGACRDYDEIQRLNYAIFCKTVTISSGKNRVYKAAEQTAISISDVDILPGDIIFGDANGVINIPLASIGEVISKALQVKRTEAKIYSAINQGSSLQKARQEYNYDKPWQS